MSLSPPEQNLEPTSWATPGAAARGETRLEDARLEIESLRRLLDAARRERERLAIRHETELDAARNLAESRELRHAAERSEDQKAFLRELRNIAEEAAEEERRESRGADLGAVSKLESVRGFEIAALENRVASLEAERDALAARLDVAVEFGDDDGTAFASPSADLVGANLLRLRRVAVRRPARARVRVGV